ncbi:acylphosphatase [Planctomycetota bacterium]
MDSGEQARAQVTFTGIVQGVGFRFTTRNVASGFAVTGYVRNESDGSVTMVAEGTRGEVEAFIAAVRQEMGGYIRGADVAWDTATGEFRSFDIRFSW